MTNTIIELSREPEMDADAKALLTVMRELSAVMAEENDQLARRVPAGLTAMIERKIRLSDEYERLWKKLFIAGADALAKNAELVRIIVASATDLRRLTEENMRRLESAAEASRRRIEAVMNAIRQEQAEGEISYKANGVTMASESTRPKLSMTRA